MIRAALALALAPLAFLAYVANAPRMNCVESSLDLDAGKTGTITCTARRSNGRLVPPNNWWTRAAAVGTISGAGTLGTVTAHAAGATWVGAGYLGARDSVRLTVRPVADTTLIVRRIRLLPDAVTLDTGATQQFCPLLVFADGARALGAAYLAAPGCAAELAKLANPVVGSPAQQAVADTFCIRWEATGGTIGASACSGVPG
jgi:hypothetical protein